jgi:hypothetical protein
MEVEIAIAKLKKCKLPGIDQIPAEPIPAGGEPLHYSLILFGERKDCFRNGRSLLLYQFTRQAIKVTSNS